jgi:hypothetical protein
MTPADFKGVTLDDLVVLEQLFSLNVHVYDLQETEAGDIALCRRFLPTISSDGRKKMGSRDKLQDVMNGWPSTVYEFQGCLWHGHRCWITKDKSVNPINGKNLDDLFKTTQEKIDEIKDQGYAVKQMWECGTSKEARPGAESIYHRQTTTL